MGGEAKKKKLLRTMEQYDALQVAMMMMMLTIMMLMVIVMEISLQASAPPGVSPYVYWTPELCAERLLHVMLHCQVQISNSNHDRGKDDNDDGQPPGGGQWQAAGLCWTCYPSVETRNPTDFQCLSGDGRFAQKRVNKTFIQIINY